MALYVFDMDGVLFRMDDPIPGAAATIQRLRDRGDSIYYLTNNSSKTRADYIAKLGRMGIYSDMQTVITSAYATALMFREIGEVGKSVYVIGEYGLVNELTEGGMNVVEYADDRQIDYVVVGWDRHINFRKLTEAHFAIARGAQFIATNRDATYPDADGRTLPGGGCIVSAVATCSGVTPRTIGKPEPYTLELILRQTGFSASECVVVGDRLDTDIGIGKAVGTRTAMVLTGVSTRNDVLAAAPEARPDWVLNDLTELP